LLMRRAGIAEFPDLIAAKLGFELSMAIQKKLGNIP